MNSKTKSLIEIHLATFLFGFAALFGKWLTVSPMVIVFGRTVFATVTLALIILFSKQSFKLSSKNDYLFLFSMGLIYIVHWFAFFQSVQVSNVAICVLTFSTFPIFVTFLEPFVFKERIRIIDIITAIVTLFGASLVIPKFEITNNLTQGALWGMLSGITFAVLILANRKNIKEYSSLVITFYQNCTCAIVSAPFVMYLKPAFHVKEIVLLILLGVLFTAITQAIYIDGLSHIKAQLASIIISLEPVYAIIFAAILLKEIPSVRTILGGLIILGAIILATFKSKQREIVLEC